MLNSLQKDSLRKLTKTELSAKLTERLNSIATLAVIARNNIDDTAEVSDCLIDISDDAETASYILSLR